MSEFDDFKTVIERRMGPLSYVLQQKVWKALYLYELSKVCEEIGDSSCFGRNWRKMAAFLIKPEPDRFTMAKLSESEHKGFEVLSKWLEINEEGTFDELLHAMVECEVYSAADELLIYLERLAESFCVVEENREDDDNEESTVEEPFLTEDEKEVKCKVDDPSEKHPEASSHDCKGSGEHGKKPRYQRSVSWPRHILERSRKLFKRSKSCQDSPPNNESLPTEPEIKPDRIFIISSREDSETEHMKKFLSFVEKVVRIKNGKLDVITIHDLPGGPTATAWLDEQVKRAEYVLICCSQKVKEIFANGKEFVGQSECNLKFTLDFLVTGQLWHDMCYNRGGKFLPILLPGNDPSCIMQCLVMFRTYNWPNEQKSIKNYLLNLPDRQPPPLGKRKPLMSKQLPTQRVA